MLQVNPLAEDDEGRLLAADAKLGFDENAAYRQKDLFALKDDSQIDPREVQACGPPKPVSLIKPVHAVHCSLSINPDFIDHIS